MNLLIDSITSTIKFLWEMSSLTRHYLSPMDFVVLGSPNPITNNNGGMWE